MEALIFLGAGLLYVILYSFASFLFSYKIYLVSNNKYNLGALVSATGLFINFTLYAFIPFFALAGDMIALSVVLTISLAIGAFLANAVMSKVDLFHTKDKKEAD